MLKPAQSPINRSPVWHWRTAIGRGAGCLWLFLAGLIFLLLGGAGGVGIDVSALILPFQVPPLALAVLVIVFARRRSIMVLSAIAGFASAGFWIWNFVQAAEFERQIPGASAVNGGYVAILMVLTSLLIAFVSVAAAAAREPGDGEASPARTGSGAVRER